MKTKIISALLAGTILVSSVQAPAMAVNPRVATYIGYAGGALLGSLIGYKISSAETNIVSKKNNLSKIDAIKAFIKQRYPIAVGCILGVMLGATTGFGVELYWTALLNQHSKNKEQLLIDSINNELATRKQHARDAYFVRKEINFDDFNKLKTELDAQSALVKNYILQSRTAHELQLFKQEQLNNFDSFAAPIMRNARTYGFYNRLPQETFKNEECSICLTNKNNIRTEFCPCSMAEHKHPTCDDCLNEWLRAHNTCPHCQGTI